MENDIQGPLKQLQTWKNTRKRVKVWSTAYSDHRFSIDWRDWSFELGLHEEREDDRRVCDWIRGGIRQALEHRTVRRASNVEAKEAAPLRNGCYGRQRLCGWNTNHGVLAAFERAANRSACNQRQINKQKICRMLSPSAAVVDSRRTGSASDSRFRRNPNQMIGIRAIQVPTAICSTFQKTALPASTTNSRMLLMSPFTGEKGGGEEVKRKTRNCYWKMLPCAAQHKLRLVISRRN